MLKKWNKIFVFLLVFIVFGFLILCIDLVINKDLVSNKLNKKVNIIMIDKFIFNFVKLGVEDVKVEDILFIFGSIKDEV